MKLNELAQLYMVLFAGLTRAYGIYNIGTNQPDENGKIKGKQIVTKRAKYGLREWVRHLKGEQGLGIVPINDENKVVWSVIDVDRYDVDFMTLIRQVYPTPLVPFRSKSGGLHLFVFFKNPVAASSAQQRLKHIASQLGFGGSEVFPKQGVLVDKSDVGQWLNMPYFNGDDTNRFAYDQHGGPLSPVEFLTHVVSKKTTLKELSELELESVYTDSSDIPDGPPCLQYLTEYGFPKGSMNRALFNLGVYYRKAFPDQWEQKVEEANKEWLTGTSKEIQRTVKSLEKKKYEYMCAEEPICRHCNKDICHTRKYGVGEMEDLPVFSAMTILMSNPPTYYLNVNGIRIGPLTTEEFIKQDRLILLVVERLRLHIQRIPLKKWHVVTNKLLIEATEMEMPKDMDVEYQLFDLLEEYCLGHNCTTNRDELINNRVWENERGEFHFRMQAFWDWLQVKHRFKEVTSRQMTAQFKMSNMKHKGVKVKQKFINVWVVTDIIKPEAIDLDLETYEEEIG